ncbi:MAG: hypothetical protein CMJ46_01095 [Planctomyces sp.]|nr:hypothetical protein [Planctomyces sp.]
MTPFDESLNSVLTFGFVQLKVASAINQRWILLREKSVAGFFVFTLFKVAVVPETDPKPKSILVS